MDLTEDTALPRARLALLLKHFSDLGDDREAWRVAYPIQEVLLLVTCATIASCDDFEDIVDWGEQHLGFLRRFCEFHHGVPCARWLRDLVNRIDPVLFGRCFESWVAALWPERHEFIAIDGKTARRTHDRRKGLKALHTLSAYATKARLTLAQLSVPEKSNEITAIPDLLDELAAAGQLDGALVSIDAMGCQVEIAAKIVAHKADYLLALKGNQPTLEADVLDYFRTAPASETAPACELATKTTVEKGHGRIETRTYSASKRVDWIASERSYPGQPRFTSIATVIKLDSRTELADRSTSRPAPTSAPRPSISSGSPRASAAIGASKACIGCSMSSSRTTCRDIEPATAPKTWPSSAASPSTSCATTKPRAASKRDENAPHGTQTFCSKFSRSNDR